MVERIGHIKNPLTVIAIFAAIAEISGTTVLPFIESENQGIYIWFLMLFPVFLIGIFFLTLNFNHKVLYAPSDYKNEDNFLKSFGKATTQEKEDKLREEVEEAEDIASSEKAEPDNVPPEAENFRDQKDSGDPRQTFVENFDKHASLLANVSLAEKLAILKLSKDMNLDFRTDVRFETPSNRKIIFDGLAIHKDKIHAVEVKLFRNENINPSRMEKVLLESELMASQMKGIDSKELVLHFVAVIDNPEVDAKRVKERLTKYIGRYNVNIKLHVITLSDLKNEYQHSP
ncbi:MAG: hypothetical protein HLX50_12960 [Alteromonadaceae bacterium]|nr:hypothetical protein [Alteromonadaceae bacterium]